MLFALIAGQLLFAMLTGRLRRLANVMDAFKRGERQRQINLFMKERQYSADEIDRLGSTFKQMAERIQAQMEKLRKSDALRRELVQDVVQKFSLVSVKNCSEVYLYGHFPVA